MASSLTPEQAKSFIEKMGTLYNVRQFTELKAQRVLDLTKAALEWEAAVKEELSKAGLPHLSDQIPLLRCDPATNESILSVQSLAPLFSLYNLDASKGTLTALLDKISSSKILDDAVTKMLTELGLSVNSDSINKLGLTNTDYILEKVDALRPEYFTGTWFNRHNRHFKVSMEPDWVSRLAGTNCYMLDDPLLFGSTGDHIWNFISEIHVHPTARVEFGQPRDGWIEAPNAASDLWNFLEADSPLNFIERMIQATGGRSVVLLRGGLGGWATFEHVANSDITGAAARLLFLFSDPLYCARSDGKVLIKFKDVALRATMKDKGKFPSGRTLVTDKNKFPSCIP